MMRDIIAAGVGLVAVAALAYASGYRAAEWRFEHDRAVAAAQQGAKDYAKLREATDIQAGLRADLARARGELERVRGALAKRTSGASGESAGGGVAGCESLLREGIDLLGSCRERLLECAGKHDALAAAVK